MDELGVQCECMYVEVEQLCGVDECLQCLVGEIDKVVVVWCVQVEVLIVSCCSVVVELLVIIIGIIVEFGMGGGQFLIELELQDSGKFDLQGVECVEFLVVVNVG